MRALLLPLLLVACSSTPSTPSPVTDTGSVDDHIFGGDRPVPLFKHPDDADPKVPRPLVLLLHGYPGGGVLMDAALGLGTLVNEKNFLLVAPDGTLDSKKMRFWNGVDTCCNFDGIAVDDVQYLTGLVEEIASVWAVDRKRVYIVGVSNGGAMAYRLACEASSTFAAAVVLAGPFWDDTTKCKPSEPVSILHVHGDLDTSIPYERTEASVLKPDNQVLKGLWYPGVQKTVEFWATANGCAPEAATLPSIDYDPAQPGAETTVARYGGCRASTVVERWKVVGAGHEVTYVATAKTQLWDWLAPIHKP